jgi:hypothetical protein
MLAVLLNLAFAFVFAITSCYLGRTNKRFYLFCLLPFRKLWISHSFLFLISYEAYEICLIKKIKGFAFCEFWRFLKFTLFIYPNSLER